jgi:hypothetical protein
MLIHNYNKVCIDNLFGNDHHYSSSSPEGSGWAGLYEP